MATDVNTIALALQGRIDILTRIHGTKEAVEKLESSDDASRGRVTIDSWRAMVKARNLRYSRARKKGEATNG